MEKIEIEVKSALGQRLKAERKRSGLTQEALGELIHYSAESIRKWETGRAGISKDKAALLGKALGCRPEYFLDIEAARTAEEQPTLDEQIAKQRIDEAVAIYSRIARYEQKQREELQAGLYRLCGCKLREIGKLAPFGESVVDNSKTFSLTFVDKSDGRQSFRFGSVKELDDFLEAFKADAKRLLYYHLLAHQAARDKAKSHPGE